MLSHPKSIQLPLAKLVLIVLLLALAGIGAVPGYLSGKWQWTQPPDITTLSELRGMRQTGLTVPNWQTLEQEVVQIGEHKWSKQTLVDEAKNQATLLLLPQTSSKTQPQVEWLDVNGAQRWKTDSDRSVNFSLNHPSARVTARFFRGWTAYQTHAVLQWYAWSGSGNPAPSQWFIADRLAQWQHRRVSWVAVSILVPIEPLDDIEKYWSKVESLGQNVQAALMVSALRP